ncbi:hypothetical protein NCCP28_24030 [Niallia sp. NCCP-28]|nr:LysM peptidoglycan-binding domain-containing protein [Niallia sp. NCCP-28]GKU83007.1 hypothetical protein NCCP28_24030 [Niallia sp. NCCP-28]
MNEYQRYKLKKKDPQSDEYILIIYADNYLLEFSDELGNSQKEKTSIISTAKQIIRERYPSFKVTMIKVMVGGIVVTALPFIAYNPMSAQAAEPTAVNSQISSSIYYEVKAGDTLWNISKKFNASIDQIKQANQLSTDMLQLNQRLLIPQAFHKVEAGDYLTVLAKKYNVSVAAIKEANGLTSDATNLGQILIIPLLINNQSLSNPAPAAATANNQGTNYIVVSGDSLSLIAKRFGTTVEALKSSNQLTSDMLRVGQALVIPANNSTAASPAKEPTASATYTVVAGDTLSVIAKKFNTSIDQIKETNNLTSDTIRVGQILTIPKAQASSNGEAVKSSTDLESIQRNLQTLGYYTMPAMTGNSAASMTEAIKNFQSDYLLPVTGISNEETRTAISHAIVKKELVKDTINYSGVPYVWGGAAPSGFDCSGFVYYMFNQHGISMSRNTSAGLFNTGTAIEKSQLQPGDLVFLL